MSSRLSPSAAKAISRSADTIRVKFIKQCYRSANSSLECSAVDTSWYRRVREDEAEALPHRIEVLSFTKIFSGSFLTIFANGGIGTRAEAPRSSLDPGATKEYVFGRASAEIDKIGRCAENLKKLARFILAYFPVQTRKSRLRRVVLQFHKCLDRNPVGKRRDPGWIPAHKLMRGVARHSIRMSKN